MRVDLTGELLDLEDKPITETPGGQTLSYAEVLVRLLSSGDPADSGEDKYSQYRIAMRIQADPHAVDLKAEEVVLVKKLVGKRCSPVTVGRLWDLLEGPLPAQPARSSPTPMPPRTPPP